MNKSFKIVERNPKIVLFCCLKALKKSKRKRLRFFFFDFSRFSLPIYNNMLSLQTNKIAIST